MRNMTLSESAQIIIEKRITVIGDCWKPSSGSFRVNGVTYSVPRLLLSVFKPNELPSYCRPEIGRSCGNIWCVNPSHLYYKSVLHRFWEKVDKKSEDECWEWKHAVDWRGYGMFLVSNDPLIREKAHRFSWILCHGAIPDGLQVLHHCDNPPCVNPKHLFLGTNFDNVRDKMRKGREAKLKGRLNGMCKLSDSDVFEIVRQHDLGLSYRELSVMFGVGTTQISRIIHRESWRWIWDSG